MLLFDQNISFRIVRLLKDVFPGCIHVSRCHLVDAIDGDIWSYARKSGLTIVTFDQDFIDIAALKGSPPRILLLKSGNTSTLAISHLLRKHHDRIFAFIVEDALDGAGVLELS